MSEYQSSMYDTPAFRAIETAKQLLADMSEGKVVDPRSQEQRQFDALFYIVKSMLIELERIGDSIELLSKNK